MLYGGHRTVVMRFPAVHAVAIELQDLNKNVVGEHEVRLEVAADGAWAIRVGGAARVPARPSLHATATIPGVVRGAAVRFDTRRMARELIAQVRQKYEAGP